MAQFKLVEKANHLHVHGHFDTKERAERHLKESVPDYCKRGFYMDKRLTSDSFEIIPA